MLTSRLAYKNVSPLLLSVNIHVQILVSTSVLVVCVANMILGYLTAPAHTHTHMIEVRCVWVLHVTVSATFHDSR